MRAIRIPLPAGGFGWLVTRPDDVRQVLADLRLHRPGPGLLGVPA